MTTPILTPLGYSHVRLTVTDIRRSKAFYELLFGMPPGSDFSDQLDDPSCGPSARRSCRCRTRTTSISSSRRP